MSEGCLPKTCDEQKVAKTKHRTRGGLGPQLKPAGNSAQKTEQATKPDRTISIPLKHGGGFSAAAQLDILETSRATCALSFVSPPGCRGSLGGLGPAPKRQDLALHLYRYNRPTARCTFTPIPLAYRQILDICIDTKICNWLTARYT